MSNFTIEWLSEGALLLRFGDGIDPAVNARVHAAATAIRAAGLPGVTDIAPAYATLLVRFDPFATAAGELPPPDVHQQLGEALRDAVSRQSGRGDDQGESTQPIDIPVCYGGDFGPDLAEVAAHAHLTESEVIARHAAGDYRVAMLGFAPGFPYLLGLDRALQMPRRANPRTRVPAGSVAIGGAQAGIYPRELPGGWQLIGRTPRVLFDPRRDAPCLLAPGDRVRFRAVDEATFAQLAERAR